MPREARDWKWAAGSVLWHLLRLLFWVALAFAVLDTPPFVALGLLTVVAALFAWRYLRKPRKLKSALRVKMGRPRARVAMLLAFVSLCALAGVTAQAMMKHYFDPPPMPETPIDALMAQRYGVVAVFVFVALVIPVIEEFGTRGWMQSVLMRKGGRVLAYAIPSIVFAFMHGSLARFPFYFATAIIWAYAVEMTQSIWTSVLAHAANNATVFTLNASGVELEDLVALLWRGGDAGALTFVAIVAMTLVAVTMRLAPDRRTPPATAAAGSDPIPATLSDHPR